jgi:signal transduction histidine kinase
VVAEALANVAKYAQATSATVSVTMDDERLTVGVADDGVGGADPSAGSGLRGLEDRVQAFGGSLRVLSRPGEGTRVLAELPLRP